MLVEKITISAKYLDYANVFSKKSVVELFEQININKHLIDLEPDKQQPYEPIYSLRSMELEILKIYIEINLANDFIHPFNCSVRASILVVQKISLSLYVDY